MQLITPVSIPVPPFKSGYRDRILLIGSCFAAEIGGRMSDCGLRACVNPFGVIYNPASVEMALRRLMKGDVFSDGDLFVHNGLYHSFEHHGCFSAATADEALGAMNGSLVEASKVLREASRLIVTWGNASVYCLAEDGRVVANCHKLPAGRFVRRRLETEEIVGRWLLLLDDLWAINPELKVVFTVSPVRYLAEGAHESRLGKATLLLAADRIERKYPDRFT